MYTTLHTHTHYSNLRVLSSIVTEKQLIDRAFQLGLKGVAITDYESVGGHVKAIEYYNKNYGEKKEKFKLILGNEIYLTRDGLNSTTHEKNEKFYHTVLLAKNKIGHQQIRELSTKSWRRAYKKNTWRVPTYQKDLLDIVKKNPGNIITTTGSLESLPANMFAMNNFEGIDRYIQIMVEAFGKENFFIELQACNEDNQVAYNKHMINKYWGEYDFIFSTNVHYLNKEDAEVYSWFLNSRPGNRESGLSYNSTYLMTYEEIKTYFLDYLNEQQIEEMRLNTNKIADSIEIYDLGHEQIVPKIKYEERFSDKKIKEVYHLFMENIKAEEHPYLLKFINSNDESEIYLTNLIFEGYYDKILNSSSSVSLKERLERLNYELEQIYETSQKIHQTLSDYFITMAKMIEIIWDEGDSLVGPGRGSASGFLINYLIGITQVDPQTQELYLPPWRLAYATHMAGINCVNKLPLHSDMLKIKSVNPITQGCIVYVRNSRKWLLETMLTGEDILLILCQA